MTVYGRSDIDQVTVGGADHGHVRSKGEKNMKVTCAECEPELRKMGWMSDPRNVELTYDERLDAELDAQNVEKFQRNMSVQSAREAAAAVRGSGRSTRSTSNGATR